MTKTCEDCQADDTLFEKTPTMIICTNCGLCMPYFSYPKRFRNKKYDPFKSLEAYLQKNHYDSATIERLLSRYATKIYCNDTYKQVRYKVLVEELMSNKWDLY
jgi:hypothetical protein